MARKISLHVGSNYPGTSAALRGCVNDATDLEAWSTRHGYETAMLLEPTDQRFLDVLTEHVRQLHYRDLLLVTVSGHGTTLAAAIAGSEPDGMDEALVFASAANPGRLTAVRDDTLADVFALVPYGARVILLSDTCFSGGLQRDTADLLGDRVAAGYSVRGSAARYRYLPPDELDLPIDVRVASLRAIGRPLVVKPRPSRVALLSGCDADEFAYDAHWTDGRWRGAYTATVLDCLDGPGYQYQPMALNRLHELVREHLPSTRYPQSPRLDANYWQRHRWSL